MRDQYDDSVIAQTVSQKARHSLMPLSSSLKCHYCDKEFSQPSGLKVCGGPCMFPYAKLVC